MILFMVNLAIVYIMAFINSLFRGFSIKGLAGSAYNLYLNLAVRSFKKITYLIISNDANDTKKLPRSRGKDRRRGQANHRESESST